MKSKFIFLSLALLLINIQINAQEGWFEQSTYTNVDLWSVCFVDENIGLAVGDSGTILKSTDGGDNWIPKMIGTTGALVNVQFSDDTTVWTINGSFNPGDVIYKSTNQGDDWNLAYSKAGHSFRGLFFVNSDTGWVGGDQGLLLRTTDSGDSWVEVAIDSSEHFFFSDIFFVDKNIGWLVVSELGGYYNQYLLKTTDGGNNWLELFGFGNQSVFFNDPNIGWHSASWISGGALWKTTSGGLIWENILSSTCGFHDVYFDDYTTGWIVAGCFDTVSSGEIYLSTNGGLDWEMQFSTEDFRLYSLHFINDQVGWVVGSSGKILKTTNGGVSNLQHLIDKIPTKFSLNQNYPNPFNPTTTINYQIPEISFITIKVYDVLGNEIATLINEETPAGSYDVEFNGNRLTSGIYFYQLRSGKYIETKKMVLIK